MNYDALLSQLADEKLNFFNTARTTEASSSTNAASTAAAAAATPIHVEEGVVEEEQAATIQTFVAADLLARTANASQKSETSTPQRKISTSTRFMNAFQQFYNGATTMPAAVAISTTATTTTAADVDKDEIDAFAALNRTPTKGMESKLITMWHNVKYGWSNKIKSNFSKEQPVWLLGRCYHRKFTPPSSMETSADLSGNNSLAMNASDTLQATTAAAIPNSIGSTLYAFLDTKQPTPPPLALVEEIVVPQELGMDAAENQMPDNPWEEGIEGFRRDFYSRLWMTYRREFPTMNGSNYTSDCGWGCMLRSGQMLLAQALICHFLGRSWRYDPLTQLHSTYEDNMHKKIIKWFGDSSSKSSPFSIHALVSLGEALGKKPGDWYGPASVSHCLK